MIDGAHTLGQIDIDIKNLEADFYIANCHKWLYSPKGTALLWVNSKWHSIIRPTVISSEGPYNDNEWYKNFDYIGSRDYTNFLSIKEALEFRKSLGDSNIKKYMHDIAWAGAKAVAAIWKTRILVDNEQLNPAMVTVELPCDFDKANQVMAVLQSKFDTVIVISVGSNIPIIRLSGQIYLELEDFTTIGNTIS